MRHRFQTKDSKSHFDYEKTTKKALAKLTDAVSLDHQTNMDFDDIDIASLTGEIVSLTSIRFEFCINSCNFSFNLR